jgi:hypothetical protein
MKKTFIVCAAVLLAGAAFCQELSDFEIAVNSTGVTITKYNGEVKNVVIPASINGRPVTEIGISAFEWKPITTVTIPAGVTTIRSFAFTRTELTVIVIPSSVTLIEAFAFSGNDLVRVTIGANVELSSDYEYKSIPNGFDDFYNRNGKKAGTYVHNGDYSNYYNQWIFQ